MGCLTFTFSIYRFVTVLVYYGLSLGVSDLGTNLYLTQFLFGLVEIPARSMVLLFLPYSRRLSQSAFLAIGGAACLLMLIVPEGDEHLHSSLPLFKNGISLALLHSFNLSLILLVLCSDPLLISLSMPSPSVVCLLLFL